MDVKSALWKEYQELSGDNDVIGDDQRDEVLEALDALSKLSGLDVKIQRTKKYEGFFENLRIDTPKNKAKVLKYRKTQIARFYKKGAEK